ncbi:hypothetical protein [Methylacidimicrobium sp. B4]|uniref:hypothetical protein n=1 Tax=Methylacidimicrobium sp. B4 TaxID=2796139 RepID=UPI001A903415|nr:hypothetical protein [Methylacidimicrobium sp. B4]QSR85564.1 hypothetical protein MacB4_04895 [Methylacidimicrobium sp. B4]
MLLAHHPIVACCGDRPEHAALAATLFLLLLGMAAMGSFAWAGYRLLKREKGPPPAYAEFLDHDVVEEVDAEFDGGGR